MTSSSEEEQPRKMSGFVLSRSTRKGLYSMVG
ncbi:hypothetical protein MNBD_GAMMA20-643 [hydrothermal vent metagenome]|uniref:Uncharacterized protein n=1 Tax=hydrothermal vent metagenome TaxID=652676 RepID=A0A3B1A5S6_9ZZZZ